MSVGRVPSDGFLIQLREWLITSCGAPLFATHMLPLLYPPSREFKARASGILAVQILPERGCYAFWFRSEVIRTVTWAGNPTKPVSIEHGQPKLGPRKSFDAWKATVEFQSLPWTEIETDSAAELRNTLSGAINGQIERARTVERKQQANQEK